MDSNETMLGREFEVTVIAESCRAKLPSPKNTMEVLAYLRNGYRLELAQVGVEPKRLRTMPPPPPSGPVTMPPISGEREVSATFRILTEEARPTVRPGVLRSRRAG